MIVKESYMPRIFILSLFICLFIDCYGQGQLTRPHSPSSKNKKSELSISKPDGYINGHGYVDLGLPSKTKWATAILVQKNQYKKEGNLLGAKSKRRLIITRQIV